MARMLVREITLGNNIRTVSFESYTSMNEFDLVNLAKTDSQAFDELFERTYSRILNYIYSRTLNVALAEELTSNTYYKALNALPRYKPNAPFLSWLFRIATNEIRIYHRKERVRKRILEKHQVFGELSRITFPSLSQSGIDSGDLQEKMEEHFKLHNLICRLPEKYQSVLTLRYYEDLTCEEIGVVLKKKTGTVKSLLSRGISKLKTMMDIDEFPGKKEKIDSLDGRGEK
jgi:RNA polymerase sigma-70 factor (ECF subfamily)